MKWGNRVTLIGILRNDDDDDNENGKKAIRLDKLNNKTLHVQIVFLYTSLPSLHDYNVKLLNFKFGQGREQKDNNFLFLFLNFDAVL